MKLKKTKLCITYVHNLKLEPLIDQVIVGVKFTECWWRIWNKWCQDIKQEHNNYLPSIFNYIKIDILNSRQLLSGFIFVYKLYIQFKARNWIGNILGWHCINKKVRKKLSTDLGDSKKKSNMCTFKSC